MVGKLHRDEAVVAGIGNTNFDLWMAGQRRQNFYMLGSMGLAIPIALGVALAQRERGLVTLEGDGNRIRRGSFSRRRYCRLQSAASLMDGEVVDGPWQGFVRNRHTHLPRPEVT